MPLTPSQPGECLDLEELFGRRSSYVLRVNGDSLSGDHIVHGDFVVIEQRGRAADGELAVVVLSGVETTLKHYYRRGLGVLLKSSNPSYPDRTVEFAEDCKVVGVVVGVLRSYATGATR